MVKIIIPIVSALLFRAGGAEQWKWCPINQKLWRWLMGIAIGVLFWKGWVIYALCIGSYFVATNLFGYGEKTPILKYLPQNIKHFMSGFMFGLASWPLVGIAALWQAVASGIVFYIIEIKKTQNPWAERLRGGLGTIIFWLK